ncbi:uncharacterized protein LOC123465373 [Bubalus bubalis]|uniref:uncharacterized protein LOC123465373 n=1 Tax=Bubalus bubalis TaxID=89462 RepID=UPI001E1B97B4|nr:uncharacterized protein LOC123465373 [Bubalus bubalis]
MVMVIYSSGDWGNYEEKMIPPLTLPLWKDPEAGTDTYVEGKQAGTVAVEGTGRSGSAPWQGLLVPEPGNPRPEVPSAHETRTYEQRRFPSLALSARRQNRSRHALRCLEGQAERSLETCGLERDRREEQEAVAAGHESGLLSVAKSQEEACQPRVEGQRLPPGFEASALRASNELSIHLVSWSRKCPTDWPQPEFWTAQHWKRLPDSRLQRTEWIQLFSL